VSRLSRIYGNLDVPEACWPPWPVTGIASPFILIILEGKTVALNIFNLLQNLFTWNIKVTNILDWKLRAVYLHSGDD
jgi:hypothetical protein